MIVVNRVIVYLPSDLQVSNYPSIWLPPVQEASDAQTHLGDLKKALLGHLR